jgi:putative sigma-54 modulation protein
MQLSVTFRHMEATDAIKDYARGKVERIKKYFPDPIMAHVVLTTERGYQHVADVNIQLHNGLIIKGRETTEDMYSSIDLVMDKIERQVLRYKEKIRHHKARPDLSSIPVAYHVLRPEAEPPPPSENGGSAPSPAPAKEPAPHVVIKTSKFFARPLTVNEAVMQMNMMHNTFLVFRNIQTHQVCVVYKRDDGNYGLIEPAESAGGE